MESWIQTILDQGLLGALLLVLGYAYYKKDQQVSQLQEMRIQDLYKREELSERVFRIAEELSKALKRSEKQ